MIIRRNIYKNVQSYLKWIQIYNENEKKTIYILYLTLLAAIIKLITLELLFFPKKKEWDHTDPKFSFVFKYRPKQSMWSWIFIFDIKTWRDHVMEHSLDYKLCSYLIAEHVLSEIRKGWEKFLVFNLLGSYWLQLQVQCLC